MSDTEKLLRSSDDSDSGVESVKPEKKTKAKSKQQGSRKQTTIKRLPFELAFAFIGFWIVIYYLIYLRYATYLPEQLKIETEHLNKGRFIGERAEQILVKIENLGERVVGSHANEVLAVQFLLNEVEKIRDVMNTDLFDMEVDVQQASGAYVHWAMLNMYQGVQNIVVKLSRRECSSQSYLLINAHFDSKPGSTGSGDDAVMVVTALEILRILASGTEVFQHPIVFLFNGAEENPLQASHGFVTQHKWAKNVKAFLNLDSGGSKNRDVVFQTGPNSPWLMRYYKDYAVHPHCTTLAEEVFQSGVIPSDTDFRIFRDFGKIIGMDIAHTYGGYVYHTKHDRVKTIPKGTIQNTGENVLALTKVFANAPEMEDPSKYATGQVVFFDVFGKFVVMYTEEEGVKLNYLVSAVSLIAVIISIIAISGNTKASQAEVVGEFLITFICHLVGLLLGVGLAVLIAVQLDNFNITLSWFTNKWMVVGLYFCPMIFGMGLPTALHISTANLTKINLSFRIQMVLNAHLVVLAIVTALITFIGFRSAYIFMLCTMFYGGTLIFNTFTTLYKRKLKWVIVVIVVQVLPFAYFLYLSYLIFGTLTPITARMGVLTNPEIFMGGISVLITLLSLGFVVPLLNMFRQSKTILFMFLMTTCVFIGIAASPYGFPFRPETNVERFNWIHVRRVVHEADNTISRNDSGFYFDPQDRRVFSSLKGTLDTSQLIPMADKCYEEMYCGLPVFQNQWDGAKEQAYWLPSDLAELPRDAPELRLIQKQIFPETHTVRYDFHLDGPPHMGIYLGPLKGVKIVDWSFMNKMLKDNWEPPYFICFSKANDQSTLKFHVILEKKEGSLDEPVMQVAIGGHWVSMEYGRSAQLEAFRDSFPPFVYSMQWPGSYERWYF